MPTVHPPAKVLVTGASGFIAAWVVKILLEKGYAVVGTVRSEKKGNYLKELFKNHSDRFSFVIVEDIAKEGAFDDAVKGCDAVEHTASPFHFKADDPQELIQPAVHGTVGILESIKKHAPGVKRVVITSSVASIVYDKGDGVTYDESDWNEQSPKEVEEKGRSTSQVHKYRASKVMAERAGWDFLEKNKDSIAFDLVTVCPPMVWGPIIQDVSSAEALNTSVAMFHSATKPVNATNPPMSEEQLKSSGGNWVDVRDVALVHVLSLENPSAGGERLITSSGGYAWQDILDTLHASKVAEYPDVPKGFPGCSKDTVHNIYLSAKVERLLGIKLKPLKETAPATWEALEKRGFYKEVKAQ